MYTRWKGSPRGTFHLDGATRLVGLDVLLEDLQGSVRAGSVKGAKSVKDAGVSVGVEGMKGCGGGRKICVNDLRTEDVGHRFHC